MNDTFIYTGIKVLQPLGEFFIGKISAEELAAMSIVEVRDMQNNDINQRLGIQRVLNRSRVREISEYVKTVDACFPNSVILSVKGKNIINIKQIADDIFQITLKKSEETFQIIDGQHRIAGLEHYDFDNHIFEINTSLFLDMDTEQQAILFATINSKQKAVDKNLLMDLHTMQNTRNPIKSAHYIGRILNGMEFEFNNESFHGALYDRIVPFYLSFNHNKSYKYTQANFIQKLVKYISGNEIQLTKDRDNLKTGEKLVYADEKFRQKLIFRNLFIDEKEDTIIKILNNYYFAVGLCWPNAWYKDGYVLARTIGFNALFLIMPTVFNKIGIYDSIISIDDFLSVFKALSIDENKFKESTFELNGSGQRELSQLFKERLEKI